MLPQGGATSVTWVMHGPVPVAAKVVHTVMNIDRMIGKDFAPRISRRISNQGFRALANLTVGVEK
jgi:hypothetical protein